MFTQIRNHITSKWLTGFMLIGVTLSFPVGFFKITNANQELQRPVVVRKPSLTKTTPKKPVLSEVSKKKPPVPAHPAPQPAQPARVWTAPPESNTNKQVSWVPVQQPAKVYHENSRNEKDIYLLARVIHAEARGEPFEGQVAVGAVLLNRLQDKRFPKTLSQIIFKRGEFCTVRDGQIWMQPSSRAIRAARLAVSGWDPTGGAVYFYNPAKTSSRWIWSRPVVNKIGNHFFAV